MQLSHSAGGNHTIFSFQVKEVSHMTREAMIDFLTRIYPEVPAFAFEQMPDEQLKGHVDEWLAEDADQLAMG
jgi:hypothetical protein